MNREKYLKEIIDEFQDWYIPNNHSKNIDYYKETITKNYLETLSKNDFKKFFTNFIYEGGKVQSGGERSKHKYIATLNNDYSNFRSFVLEPFDRNFNLQDWFKRIDDFNGFGIGIATIYLNRVNTDVYPIMNNKTLNASNKLGYQISSTKNFSNYELVKKIQTDLITQFPVLENFYKADAFNHFIIAEYEGKWLIDSYIQLNAFEDRLEQEKIAHLVETDSKKLNKDELYQQIVNCAKDNTEYITIQGKRVKRHNYLMVKIKEYRGYKCQFCSHEIPKENGGFYIEACHINAKYSGGKDSLENILILCPNCHKLFDNWSHENEKWTKNEYRVTLNGKEYKAKIKQSTTA